MNKKWCSIVVLIAGFGIASGTQAQEPDETIWRFAFNETSVIAYTLDGTVNVLQTGEYDNTAFCYQLGSETALLRVYGEPGLQHLTPDTIEPLILAPGVEEIELAPSLINEFGLSRILMISPTRDYVILGLPAFGSPNEIGLLVNLSNRLVERLTGTFLFGEDQVRFSEDGHYLRYSSRTDAGEELRERELITGTEHVVYSARSYSDPLRPADPYGQRWLEQNVNKPAQITSYRLIGIDGRVEEIAVFHHHNPDYPDEDGLVIRALDEALITYKGFCGADCKFEVQPLNTSDPVTFIGPEITGYTGAFPLRWIDETHLLVQLFGNDSSSEPDVWLLGSDGSAKAIGFSPNRAEIFMVSRGWLSTRWYVVSDAVVASYQRTEVSYRVWDSVSFKYVLAGNFDTSGYFMLDSRGIVVIDDGMRSHTGLFYRASDGRVFRFPERPAGQYYGQEILPADTFLYQQHADEQAPMEPGLYRYDPVAETYSLLVAGEGWRACNIVPPLQQ